MLEFQEDVEAPTSDKDPSWRIKALFEYYRDRPMAFFRDVLGLDGQEGRPYLDPWQHRCSRALVLHHKVLVPGARSVGKNFWLAAIIIWFLCTRPWCKIIVTAVKHDTLMDNVWAEVSQMLRRAPQVEQYLNVGPGKIAVKGAELEWWAVPRVAAVRSTGNANGEKQAPGIAGKYAPGGVLYIIDEMSGVPNAVIEGIQASSEGEERYVIGTFNPVTRIGLAADYCLKKEWQGEFYVEHVSYLDSHMTNQGRAKILKEREIKRRGINSPYVRANIFGQFPIYAQANVVLEHDEIRLACERVINDDPELKVVIGIDVARFGDDETVIYVRRGLASLEMWVSPSTKIPEITGRAIDLAMKYVSMHPQYGTGIFNPKEWVEFRVDVTGMGAGVVDELEMQGWEVAGVANNAATTDPEQYEHLGDELWFDMKRVIKRASLRVMLTNDEILEGPIEEEDILVDQLSTRTYNYTGKGQVQKVTPKAEMKTKGLGSPDRADACILAFADHDKLPFASKGQFSIA